MLYKFANYCISENATKWFYDTFFNEAAFSLFMVNIDLNWLSSRITWYGLDVQTLIIFVVNCMYINVLSLIFIHLFTCVCILLIGRYISIQDLVLYINIQSIISIFIILYSWLIIHNISLVYPEYDWWYDSIINITLNTWLSIEYIDIKWQLLIDSLSCIMLLVIIIISICASIYSMDYMSFDINLNRYYAFSSLFIFCMLILVTSSNLLLLFIGWEGVCICSYLLINFWYCRYQANKSSILAILSNKIGDIALLVLCIMIQYSIGTMSFEVINNYMYLINDSDYINNLSDSW
jgi:NADH:ubiquinone oxidoreductase subunit 5 (subunit L)/multisubunit Na+/H+ antiporter MnhA subunit